MMSKLEFEAMKQAAAVLGLSTTHTVNLSQLSEIAAVEACHRLGFFTGVDSSAHKRPDTWKDAPEKVPGSSNQRTTMSFAPPNFELITAVVDYLHGAEIHAHLTTQMFIRGATLRYIAEKKKAQPKNKALQAIQLPEKFSS